jgi:hypothetical protein
MLHVEGMSAIQFDALPSELRGKWSQEYYGSEIRYYMEFESEEAAALFKLEYM